MPLSSIAKRLRASIAHRGQKNGIKRRLPVQDSWEEGMANTQYLFWVMFGALALLSVVVSTFVGMSRSARQGFITLAVLWVILAAGALYISH
ncbi:hypothetical protein [Pantoea ananatis]|uniref:hypothetical protein n=1 Tax=Pantoea ananas TaxID=553 RepID=UPI0006468E5D|nr:hypothetical protein [Pantoea ananatis]MCW1774664.1 hypothetical protein [Pantoea ananatis]PZD61897.1 hypothetical protein ARC310_12220 [Pantoea ananatis]PZD63323.1 hypothetical protein ARC311_13515 [Pantoea ananatis]UYK95027.1 hypothetical protein NG826_06680 [Pantoea ananatis]